MMLKLTRLVAEYDDKGTLVYKQGPILINPRNIIAALPLRDNIAQLKTALLCEGKQRFEVKETLEEIALSISEAV